MPKLIKFTRLLLAAAPTAQLRLVPFFDYNGNDMAFAEQLTQTLNDSRVELEMQTLGDFKETVEAIGSKEAVFSMRYHGTLLANLLGKRVICINYDSHRHYFNKNRYLYSHYGFSENVLSFSLLGSVTGDQISNLLQSTVKGVDTKKLHLKARKDLLSALKGIK